MPSSALVHPWEGANNAWVRLHTDLLGPFMRKMFLVIADSYSKLVLLEMCSQFHIQQLKQLLTVQGLVLQLMDYHKFMPHIMDHISQVKNLNVF